MARDTRKKIVTKKHLARIEKERRQRRYIIITTLVVVGLVVALLGYGILEQYVLRPYQPVAKVNGDSISTREFQTQGRYARSNIVSRFYQMQEFAAMFGDDPSMQQYFNSSIQQLQAQLNTDVLGQQVLDNLIDDRLIRQEAERRGITVTKEEVDQAIEEAFGFYENGAPTPTVASPTRAPSTLSPTQLALVSPTPLFTPTSVPTETVTTETPVEETPVVEPTAEAEATAEPEFTATPTEIPGPTSTPAPTLTPTPYTRESYQTNYADTVKRLTDDINFTEKDLFTLFESQLYREKVMDVILADLPREQEQVWARHILVADEAAAQDVLLRLQNGEDWTALVEEVSTDFTSTSGGDLGWFSRDGQAEEVAEAAFKLQIGEISQPVQSQAGWHIIQALGHETRPLNDGEYESLRMTKFIEWLDAQREASDVTIYDYWKERVPTEPSIPSSAL